MEALFLILKDEEVNTKLTWKNITTSVTDSVKNFGIRELFQRQQKLLWGKFFYKKLQKDGLPLLFGQNCVERCPGAGLADFFLWQIGFCQGAGQDYAPRLIFCPIQILPPG